MGIVERLRRTAARTPDPEVEPTADLVRALLRDQHPDLAALPITFGAPGWANQMWRLGDDLAVRLPWRGATADALLVKEHAWLPQLAPRLPLPVPVPQRFGAPSDRYPRPWMVTTWVPGTPADRAPVVDGAAAAEALAAFLVALHQLAADDAPVGEGRGGPLADLGRGVTWQLRRIAALCDEVTATTMTAAHGGGSAPDPAAIRAVWDDAVAAPRWEGPRLWLHGDLHPANVLTTDGTLTGVVDFGDLCAGDPALDLAAGWILLPDRAAIERFRAACPLAADEATWRRARGWAVWRACGSLTVATSGPPGGKPSWGPPAVASLHRLTASTA